jgi:DNA polymerase
VTLIKSDAVSKYLKQTKDLYGDQLFLSLDNGFNHVDSTDESLDQFFDRINQCQKCQLGQTRTNFVFGVGDPNADLVLVGEAPVNRKICRANLLLVALGNYWIKFSPP